jgi:hypothetical protein
MTETGKDATYIPNDKSAPLPIEGSFTGMPCLLTCRQPQPGYRGLYPNLL